MSGKAKRPCHGCGRGMAIHRGKRTTCSTACRDLLKHAVKWRERMKAMARGRRQGVGGESKGWSIPPRHVGLAKKSTVS
jgi:predicted nucleic acid-binding Zn ribbon protein